MLRNSFLRDVKFARAFRRLSIALFSRERLESFGMSG